MWTELSCIWTAPTHHNFNSGYAEWPVVENEARKTDYERIVKVKGELAGEMNDLRMQVRGIEPYSRWNNVEIVEVPLCRNENVLDIVEIIARMITVDFNGWVQDRV